MQVISWFIVRPGMLGVVAWHCKMVYVFRLHVPDFGAVFAESGSSHIT